ncbi:MAG: hypothetical protein J5791_06720 [Fibrobacter sp.]|nr:hypothetical protein [Fibrobacter sp.]
MPMNTPKMFGFHEKLQPHDALNFFGVGPGFRYGSLEQAQGTGNVLGLFCLQRLVIEFLLRRGTRECYEKDR